MDNLSPSTTATGDLIVQDSKVKVQKNSGVVQHDYYDTDGNWRLRVGGSGAEATSPLGVYHGDVASLVVRSTEVDTVGNPIQVGDPTQPESAVQRQWVESRGSGDLVTNGTLYMRSNYNFSSATYQPADSAPGCGGSVERLGNTSFFTDEKIPVVAGNRYQFKWYARQANPGIVANNYLTFICYDASGAQINYYMYYYQAGTTTTLAQPLNPGDDFIYLTSANLWNDGPTGHYRTIAFWNFVDENGRMWPTETYTKWYTPDAWDEGTIDRVGHKLVLRVPWAGGAYPAGHPVSNTQSGGTYNYLQPYNFTAPEEWTEYSGYVEGEGKVATQFRPGTAFIKFGVLTNRDDTANSNVRWSGMSVRQVGPSDGAGHDHDSLYYPRGEVDTLLGQKSSITHNHDSDYSPIGHNHAGTYDPAGTGASEAASAITAHEAAGDPHSQYATDTDLTNGLAGKANTAHNHVAGDITSGTMALARIPTGTTGSTVALGDHNHSGVYDPAGTGASQAASAVAAHEGAADPHPQYMSQAESDALYSPLDHQHDSRYYTEAEVNSLLSGKSDTSHNHDSAYVNVGGDTMTGDLLVPNIGGAGPELAVRSATTGTRIYGTTHSLLIPADTQVGDVIVAFAPILNESSSTIWNPITSDGFALLPGMASAISYVGEFGSNKIGAAWYYKVADGSDPGRTITWTYDGSINTQITALVLRGATPPTEATWEYHDGNTLTTLPAGAATWSSGGLMLAVGLTFDTNAQEALTTSYGTQGVKFDSAGALYPAVSVAWAIEAAGPSVEVAWTATGTPWSYGTGLLMVPGIVAASLGVLSNLDVQGSVVVSGVVNMNGNVIQNVAAPVDLDDAVNKNYTDSALAGKSDTTHNHDSAYYNISGDLLQGTMDANGNSITNLVDQTAIEPGSNDAVSRAWVEGIGGTSAHGSLGGLDLDHHLQYAPIHVIDAADPDPTEHQRTGQLVVRKNVTSSVDTDFLQRQGGQMTGPLLLQSNPTVDLEAASKAYVDTPVAWTVTEGAGGVITLQRIYTSGGLAHFYIHHTPTGVPSIGTPITGDLPEGLLPTTAVGDVLFVIHARGGSAYQCSISRALPYVRWRGSLFPPADSNCFAIGFWPVGP